MARIKSKILITGGGGFVGTQVAWELADHGHEVTIVDRNIPVHNFPGIYKVADYLEYFQNPNNSKDFDTVIHLAADHLVGHSVMSPSEYYTNNVVKMKAMLDIMVEHKIKNIMFSSSGNVYGRQGTKGPLTEDMYYDPENPYASTKVAGEMLIKDYARAYGLNYVIFRYFNAAGADPNLRFGYVQRPATHVIPILCNAILNKGVFNIYGDSYDTRDGTCIRDYVHIADLANAHLFSLELFEVNSITRKVFNLGCGSGGVSVKDLLNVAQKVTGTIPEVNYAQARTGDPAILTADISNAGNYLGWSPQFDITDIISHAYKWEEKYEASK